MRAEHHGDVCEWVIGRSDTGEFIAVPPVAADTITLLRDGLTVEETRRRILLDHQADVDVASFASDLVELGFVAAVDGVAVPGHEPPRSTLPRMRAQHVRWLVSVPFLTVAALLVVAAGVATAVRPQVLPSYHDLLWSDHTTLVIVGNVIIAWLIVGVHEFGHLATARAYGVGGRVGFATRLQFLCAQTDVSGIWGAPRRARIIVYLSGIGVNLIIAATATLVRLPAAPGTLTDRVAATVSIISLLALPPQLLMFMRTDLYFALQDLTGCRNLYADGSAYLRYLAHPRRRSRHDPTRVLPAHERTAVRLYSIALAMGTAVCLAVALTITLPFAVTVASRTVNAFTAGNSATVMIDAVVTSAIIGTYWTVWGFVWWRRHGGRVRRFFLRTAPAEEFESTPVRR
ncbi:M50 family metallopeptidase [Actinoplanes hulinensis]|uniref:M50 family metallopeptidase n=1 Tax=Actinoplanes hulinensis TaxID=1144547 RepID=A0ABS7BEI9_9ACTN|nr:M50 family metallopeptidase [Actinoplanes hulinensis]MBW6439287.1 M50 family metallopeptidase [Actinoplanes hulinensis]